MTETFKNAVREGEMTPSERIAGRVLDAEVAERVMGWSKADFRYAAGRIAPTPNSDGTRTHATMGAGDWSYEEAWMRSERENAKGAALVGFFEPVVANVPDYSTDIAAAVLILDLANACRSFASLCNTPDGTWLAQFGAYDAVEATTAPLAICLAAIAAPLAFESAEACAKRVAREMGLEASTTQSAVSPLSSSHTADGTNE